MYNYCNKCSGKLIKKASNLYLCQKCGLHFYVNPVQTTTVILENEKGEILLVKRKSDPKKGFWDLPGGFTNLNESAEQSLAREIKEELGIGLRKYSYLTSYPDRYLYKGQNYYTINLFYVAKINKNDQNKISPHDDVTGLKFFSKEKIPWEKLGFVCLKKVLRFYFLSQSQPH
jgi:ADP-ribose pyrophosphatase YjhB (NUDIX family)